VHGAVAAQRYQLFRLLAVVRRIGQLGIQFAQFALQGVRIDIIGNMPLRARREGDVLLPRLHFIQGGRFRPFRAPQVDHEDQGVDVGRASSTVSSGVFEYRPPSQYKSPSTRTPAKPGGKAPLARICSAVSGCR